MNQDFKVVILAIPDQSSFPGKLMVDLQGKPLLQHVYEQASHSAASEVVIATDNTRIGMDAEDFGATVCMIVDEDLVGINHLSAVADKQGWGDETIVVNIPADAPMIDAAIIDQLAQNLISNTEHESATLFASCGIETAEGEDTIKLVTDANGGVLYLSRLLIPHQLSAVYPVDEYKTCLGVTAYRAGLLRIYRNLPSSDLDRVEDIEELKLLYNGIKIHAAEAEHQLGPRVVCAEDIDSVISALGETS